VKDLVVLAACKDGECALRGLLSRPQSLGIRPVEVTWLRHEHRDPGCRTSPERFLAGQVALHQRALVVFDREGCGIAGAGLAAQIESEVEARLATYGWEGRAGCVVIEPELEAWVWSASRQVDEVLGWKGREPGLREWLASRGFLPPDGGKPTRPKEAMQAAVRRSRTRWSPSLFQALGERVSIRGCEDRAMLRLLELLRGWFPPPVGGGDFPEEGASLLA
jgi:hypothetical protein